VSGARLFPDEETPEKNRFARVIPWESKGRSKEWQSMTQPVSPRRKAGDPLVTAPSLVTIKITPESKPTVLAWMGE
jgi:hypothetical protein